MPSLFTHLLVAEQALEQLGPDARGLLRLQAAPFYLGCLAPDFPYYQIVAEYRGMKLGGHASALGNHFENVLFGWLSRRPAAPGGRWVDMWHQPGASAWMKAWLGRLQAGENVWRRETGMAAFLCGMLCHVAADEAMHPVIEAATDGPDAGRSQRLHRSLEMHLDFHWLRRNGLPVAQAAPSAFLSRWIPIPAGQGRFFPEWLAQDWVALNRGTVGPLLDRGLLGRWIEGFDQALRLLDHPLSPLWKARQEYLAGGPWERIFETEDYWGGLYLPAVAACTKILEEAWAKPMTWEGAHARG